MHVCGCVYRRKKDGQRIGKFIVECRKLFSMEAVKKGEGKETRKRGFMDLEKRRKKKQNRVAERIKARSC